MGLALDEPEANEALTSINGLDILVAPEVKRFAEGAVLDYEKSFHGDGFTVQRGGYSGC